MKITLARAPTDGECAFVVERARARGFNYPGILRGRSDEDARALTALLREAARERDGGGASAWVEDRTSTVIGVGEKVYRDACEALRRWEQFDLGWTSVSERTGTATGDGVCVCARVAGVWMANPLQVVELRKDGGKKTKGVKKRFALAHGTMEGHVLRGEERFAIELGEDGAVTYESYAFSAPGNAIGILVYPIARVMQRRFHADSAKKMREIVGRVRDEGERK